MFTLHNTYSVLPGFLKTFNNPESAKTLNFILLSVSLPMPTINIKVKSIVVVFCSVRNNVYEIIEIESKSLQMEFIPEHDWDSFVGEEGTIPQWPDKGTSSFTFI